MNISQAIDFVNPAAQIAAITVLVDGVERTIRFSSDEAIATVAAPTVRQKPGPKSLPKTKMKSIDLHDAVLDYLSLNGPSRSEDIQAHVAEKFESANLRNTTAWALVELQNVGRKRSKNALKLGPIVNLGNSVYALRQGKFAN